MKVFVILGLSTMLLSCSSYDSFFESDYSYSGSFGKYRTFSFIQNNSFEGSDEQADLIEEYVGESLESWRYKYKENKADLMVIYSFSYEDVRFQSFRQPSFEDWIKTNYSNEIFGDTINASFEKVRRTNEAYDKQPLDLKEGTILISLYDRKKRMTVWQGYSSGVFGPNNIKNQRTFRYVIGRIMYEYRLLANEKNKT